MPACIVLTPKETIFVETPYHSQAEKIRVMASVAETARMHRAYAVIVINDAYCRNVKTSELASYRHGDLKRSASRQECIMVSVKQADGKCWLLYSPYMQEEGQFKFDQNQELRDVELNILPAFWGHEHSSR